VICTCEFLEKVEFLEKSSKVPDSDPEIMNEVARSL
jgi:hypothetical protein